MDTTPKFQKMLDKAIENEPAFKNFDRTKNVQDQLQEMVDDKNVYLRYVHGDGIIKYCRICNDYGEPVSIIYPTLEQLWLAFVMKEKYKKVWDDEKEEWIIEMKREEK